MNPFCPKCGRPMSGPRYVPAGNLLEYTSMCGYTMTAPALDSGKDAPSEIDRLRSLISGRKP